MKDCNTRQANNVGKICHEDVTVLSKRCVNRLGLLVSVILILVVLLTVSACGGSRREIIGKWQEVDGRMTFEFFKEGTVVHVGYLGSNPLTLTGSYKFIDDTHIRMDFEGIFGGANVYEFHISGDRMTLDYIEYTRIK